MTPDSVAAMLRAVGLAALFQAVGGVAFLTQFGRRLSMAGEAIRNLTRWSAVVGIVFAFAHGCDEAGRLSGDFSGIADADMMRLSWLSPGGAAHALQMFGLALIAASLMGGRRPVVALATTGAIMTTAAFAGTGHTSVHPSRSLLAPMLIVHVMIGAYWYGALGPMYLVVRGEPAGVAVGILTGFSRVAGWLVPGLAIAGLAITIALVPGISVLEKPYGRALTVKAAILVVLLLLAGCNRWRHLPAMKSGRLRATVSLERSILGEIFLITLILIVTAVLTTYFSPGE